MENDIFLVQEVHRIMIVYFCEVFCICWGRIINDFRIWKTMENGCSIQFEKGVTLDRSDYLTCCFSWSKFIELRWSVIFLVFLLSPRTVSGLVLMLFSPIMCNVFATGKTSLYKRIDNLYFQSKTIMRFQLDVVNSICTLTNNFQRCWSSGSQTVGLERCT